jgi:uncharacterized membrane protein
MAVARFALARRVTLLLWVLLIAMLAGWHASLLAASGAVALTALTVVPMLLPLRGLWRAERRSYRWAPLTLAPAMAWSLTEIVANPQARGIAALAALVAFFALAAVVATLRTMPR